MKNILLWTSFGKEERKWVNKAGLVSLFKIGQKTPHHNILVEFFNNQKLDFEHNKIKVMVEESRIIDKHLLTKVFKIYHTSEAEVDQAEMSNVRIALTNIANKVLDTYNTNERWVVQKMKPKYVNRILAILPIIYQKYKVQYFNNKFAMMISKADHGESMNWDIILYSQLVKKFIRWDKCQKNMIERIAKREPKKGVCHSTIVLEVLFQKWFSIKVVEPQEKKKQNEQP